MDLLIWGAGAIGGTIGAYLAKAGHQVVLVDRVREHVDAIQNKGLSISGPVDEPRFRLHRLTSTFLQTEILEGWGKSADDQV